tara:strand:- start:587 stop:1624 length:1038 start_codon:yes stop_codon:yes gene_type:complete
MAFLDNSGDIILDAVLTDLGRKRLAAGNFNIAKFALGDEEVNYGLWAPGDTRGSAFYDLEIMQTPLLEAFTSDQSLMKSRLMTLVDDSLLYLPTLKVNGTDPRHSPYAGFPGFYLMADTMTYNIGEQPNDVRTNPASGILHGVRGKFSNVTTHICIDQGIDSGDSSLTIADDLPGELLERSFIVKVDHRLISLDGMVSAADHGISAAKLNHQFIDDDGIATYYIVDSQFGSPIMGPRDKFENASIRSREEISNSTDQADLSLRKDGEVFDGPLGSVLRLVPRASDLVQRGESLFDEFGNTGANLAHRGGNIQEYKFIDTTISIAGATTGFSIDVPIRIIKGTKFA